MPRRQFNADLASAMGQVAKLPDGFAVDKSESDGELILTYTTERLSAPFSVHIMCPDLDEYPKTCQYFLFTDDEKPPEHLTKILDKIQYSAENLGVLEVIEMLSSALTGAVEESEDTEMTDVDFEDDDEGYFDEEDTMDFMDDDVFGLPATRHIPRPPTISLGRTEATELSQRIKQDFRKVRDAGFRVNVLQGLNAEALSSIASMSVRASKLGLSEEALQAWDIKTSDYVIVLLRIDGTYPTLESLLDQPNNYKDQLSFRIGKCDRYKTNLEDALLAFNPKNGTASNKSTGKRPEETHKTGKFFKTLVSTSLDQFMDEAFIHLMKLRHRYKSSWDSANEQLIDSMGRVGDYVGGSPKRAKLQADDDELSSDKLSLPKVLQQDHLMDESESERSLPLVAMNFAMEYLVNCAKYCLRCHRKVYEDFGAMKPYVCSNPLCLFQYMSMGIGPSTEHEIIAQPKVVDLLVSFCYQALGGTVINELAMPGVPAGQGPLRQLAGLRDIPVGLRIKAPTGRSNAVKIGGQIDLKAQSFVITEVSQQMHLLAEDQWVVIVLGKIPPPKTPLTQGTVSTKKSNRPMTPTGPAGSWNLPNNTLQIKIKTIHFATGSVEFQDLPATTWSNAMGYNADMTKSSVANIRDAYLLLYDTDIDDLAVMDKVHVMKFVLGALPSITAIRTYLKAHPEKRIRDVPEVTPAAASLLEWIVASNRSCIVETGNADDMGQNSVETADPTVVTGMKGWMQFRFAQGSPDKEIRFNKALQDIKSQKGLTHGTLFAWHGSSLANWHSIVRTGLNFNVVSHGRAFGDGVYFSPHFQTSAGYSAASNTHWPNSELNVDTAISLNEIVNYPSGYKSQSPHYVVDNLDWFQTRFLFVRCSKRAKDGEVPGAMPMNFSNRGRGSRPAASVPDETSKFFYPQDPARIPIGSENLPIKIPMAAMPSSRVNRTLRASTSAEAQDSESEDLDDVEWLRIGQEKTGNLSSRSSVDSLAVREITTKRPMTPAVDPRTVTKFTPGTLDLSKLPLMAPPSWASSSAQRGIAAELKKLETVQSSSPQSDLGYYIDFEKVDNLFQWIVELHSFDLGTPLGKDMEKAGVSSIVCEVRFGAQFPFTPPFLRVIRPRFLPFQSGGGGHVTIGGAMCMELLTTTGWSPANAMESVLLQVRMALLSNDPKPARLDPSAFAKGRSNDYGIGEAIEAYKRAAQTHGWEVPKDFMQTATGTAEHGAKQGG